MLYSKGLNYRAEPAVVSMAYVVYYLNTLQLVCICLGLTFCPSLHCWCKHNLS